MVAIRIFMAAPPFLDSPDIRYRPSELGLLGHIVPGGIDPQIVYPVDGPAPAV
jgi:hypothetical protein